MTTPSAEADRERPVLMTRALRLRCVSIFGASASFYLLLSVVPLEAKAASGRSNAAGLATGALMLATVVGELLTPRLVARVGYRLPLGAGLLLLGLPALGLTLTRSLPVILVICLVRGLGFAVTIVGGGALTASLLPPERRGEGLALVGLVSGAPSLIALPLGVWLAEHAGYDLVAIAAAVVAVAAVAAVPPLPDPAPAPGPAVGMAAGLTRPALVRPAVVFGSTALAAGILVTFLPLAIPRSSTTVVTVALFVQPAASAVSRWVGGRLGDRGGPARLVLPSLLISAAGVMLTALTHSAVAVLLGVAIFGAGFGIAQNATLTLMYLRVPASGYGTVTGLWNLAYDGGMGVGAVAFGVLAGATGYPAALALTGGLMLVAVLPAVRDRFVLGPGVR